MMVKISPLGNGDDIVLRHAQSPAPGCHISQHTVATHDNLIAIALRRNIQQKAKAPPSGGCSFAISRMTGTAEQEHA